MFNMKIFTKNIGTGIVLGIGDEDSENERRFVGQIPIKGEKPRGFYVYFHRDSNENIFYIGKGTGDRAWSSDRHPIWNKYVTERLGGEYHVEIYRDSLDEDEAEKLEAELIEKYGEHLVNWINPRRKFDDAALEPYHELRDKNRKFVADTRTLEKTDPEQAVQRYRQALATMRDYESMTLETGLIADLGPGPDWGDYNILDRLTLTLIKLGRNREAIDEAESYFADFPSALNLASVKKIVTRIAKSRERLTSPVVANMD